MRRTGAFLIVTNMLICLLRLGPIVAALIGWQSFCEFFGYDLLTGTNLDWLICVLGFALG